MRRTLALFSAVLFSLGTVALSDDKPASDDKPVVGDLAKFQGTWEAQFGPEGASRTVTTIKGRTLTFETTLANGAKRSGTCTVSVDEQAKPHKAIDFSGFARIGAPGAGRDPLLGIYRFIDENTVELCNGAARPAEFQDGGGSRRFTWRRKSDNGEPKP